MVKHTCGVLKLYHYVVITSMLQKFRKLQIRGVQGEAVYAYREPWKTKEIRLPRLSRRVKIDQYFLGF